VDLRDVQIAARHADPRTTMRYDRARKNLDVVAQDMLQVRAFPDLQVGEGNRLALCQILACHLEQWHLAPDHHSIPPQLVNNGKLYKLTALRGNGRTVAVRSSSHQPGHLGNLSHQRKAFVVKGPVPCPVAGPCIAVMGMVPGSA